MASLKNIQVTDMKKLFNAMHTRGEKGSFKGEPGVPNMVESHVQGFTVARINGKKVGIATHNNKGYSKGFMMYCYEKEGAIKQDVPIEHYNHPGGFQVIGDYAIVAVEDSKYEKSYVRLCKLTNLGEHKKPEWVEGFQIKMDNHGSGMVGAAAFKDGDKEKTLIVINDNKTLYIYEGEGGEALIKNPVKFLGSHKASSFQGLSLVTQKDNKVFLVGYCSYYKFPSYEDKVELWVYNPSKKRFDRSIDAKHIYTRGGGAAGVHLRYGSGLTILDENHVEFYATQRNFVGGKLNYDVFEMKI